ncbi:MAG: type III polyketide synthase [Alphaproteobacteria bacterium]|nr:type III polyketide synthase [Alphaproteobacteria bacterium]
MTTDLAQPPAQIYAVATAYPSHVMRQDEVAAKAAEVFGHKPDYFRRMAAAYGNAGVETRYSCVPLDWYLEPHGWPERTQLYEENAIALLTEAATATMKQANIKPADIAATVVVSSTGVVTPSLDSLLQGPLSLKPSVQRLPIFGLGCAGGVIGLSRAAALAGSIPGQWVLFLCVELCGLTFRQSDDSKANLIGTAIFGDGAAALLVKVPDISERDRGSSSAAISAWGEHTWPDSRDTMGWRVEDDGLGVVFSRDIPNLVRRELRPVTDRFLRQHELALSDLDGVLCHPGGEKVLSALEASLELEPNALRHARSVLRDRGNMSAVTVLAVLKQALEAGDNGRHLMTALGPGFTAGMALLDLQ